MCRWGPNLHLQPEPLPGVPGSDELPTCLASQTEHSQNRTLGLLPQTTPCEIISFPMSVKNTPTHLVPQGKHALNSFLPLTAAFNPSTILLTLPTKSHPELVHFFSISTIITYHKPPPVASRRMPEPQNWYIYFYFYSPLNHSPLGSKDDLFETEVRP